LSAKKILANICTVLAIAKHLGEPVTAKGREKQDVQIIKTDGKTEWAFIKRLKDRGRETEGQARTVAAAIIEAVRLGGDKACDEYTLKLDGFLPAVREVPSQALQEALAALPEDLAAALSQAAANIRDFHRRQLPGDFEERKPGGIILGRKSRGLHRVGIYVPGGRAAYPSTVLMNAIPAKIAGVEEIIMVTPPQKEGGANQAVLAAAALAGVDRVFLLGGAQAAAALAYGTETVPKVDKLVGPGNIYVAAAKKLLYGQVDIDMVAGPSEILILADETANPVFAAADLLSQAEHDVMAAAMLVTHSPALAAAVVQETARQAATLERREIIAQALQDYGVVFVTRSLEESIGLANALAPEHLEVMTENPLAYLDRLTEAGSLFLGHYSPEPLGDYFAGPNHVLPTGFTARFFSPLSVESFLKYYSYTYYPRQELLAAAPLIRRLAVQEGLTAHAGAIAVRENTTSQEA
jgi:histidinol dehydrogenase